jgi:hypothetical protein
MGQLKNYDRWWLMVMGIAKRHWAPILAHNILTIILAKWIKRREISTNENHKKTRPILLYYEDHAERKVQPDERFFYPILAEGPYGACLTRMAGAMMRRYKR